MDHFWILHLDGDDLAVKCDIILEEKKEKKRGQNKNDIINYARNN